MNQDTIVAAASAMSSAGIGIIRISGENAFSILERIFQFKNERKKVFDQPSYTIHYGNIYDGEELLDEVIVLLMKGPHSYTMEDTVEIDCHGGILLMRRILETVIREGARPAEPGEFTKRAFLNGRIDLSQAEAVMDVIQAGNRMALESSLSQLKGSVANRIRGFREKILYETAFLESALDDPEHISLEGYGDRLSEILRKLNLRMKALIDSFENGRIIKEGIKTVILGKPNAGKSSLLNVLLGEERAIVTEIAGTTRDILEEELYLNGISLRLLDTAGIRKTEDLVEQIGVGRAKEQAEQADLILYVVDSSRMLDEDDASVIEKLIHCPEKDMVVTDIGNYLEESMKVVEQNGKLIKISKEITKEEALGSSIDVYKFSAEGGNAFFAKCTEYIEQKRKYNLWSEVALNDIFAEVKFVACPLEGRWVEIDNLDDLKEAEEKKKKKS